MKQEIDWDSIKDYPQRPAVIKSESGDVIAEGKVILEHKNFAPNTSAEVQLLEKASTPLLLEYETEAIKLSGIRRCQSHFHYTV